MKPSPDRTRPCGSRVRPRGTRREYICLPRLLLERVARIPADGGRVEQDLRAGQRHEARGLREPLLPADQNAQAADRARPGAAVPGEPQDPGSASGPGGEPAQVGGGAGPGVIGADPSRRRGAPGETSVRRSGRLRVAKETAREAQHLAVRPRGPSGTGASRDSTAHRVLTLPWPPREARRAGIPARPGLEPLIARRPGGCPRRRGRAGGTPGGGG